MPKLFGTIDLIDSNDIFRKNSRPLAYSKSLSNEFELIAQVELEKILELDSGEVVFSSQSKKSNLLIFNPQNGLIVSIGVLGKIKIWDPNNLNLINEAMVKNPVYARILKNGRLVYSDKDFNLFISL